MKLWGLACRVGGRGGGGHMPSVAHKPQGSAVGSGVSAQTSEVLGMGV